MKKIFLILITLNLFYQELSFGQAGTIDSTFDFDGIVLGFANGNTSFASVAVQSDGKIVVGAGSFLQRFDSYGITDNTFGLGGIANSEIIGYSIAVQNDGKIVMGGKYGSDFGIERYNINGTLDSTFGINGKTIIDIGANEYCTSIAIQQDGKIVMGGKYSLITDRRFAIARVDSSGDLDTNFGNGGFNIDYLEGGTGPASIAIQSTGKIVYTSDNFKLVRYSSVGLIDSTFGINGIDSVDFINCDSYSLACQTDDKIVVCGNADNGMFTGFGLARLNSNGTMDNTFGGQGKVITDMTISFNNASGGLSLVIQTDGKIIVGGQTGIDNYVVLARYNSNGTLDGSFGLGGKVFTYPGVCQNCGAAVTSLALQPDGKIIAAGSYEDYNFFVNRYLNDINLGITNILSESSTINIYPNPANEKIFIRSNSNENFEYTLTNIFGEIVKCNTKAKSTIYVSDIPSGIYFLQVHTKNNSVNKKVVVQH